MFADSADRTRFLRGVLLNPLQQTIWCSVRESLSCRQTCALKLVQTLNAPVSRTFLSAYVRHSIGCFLIALFALPLGLCQITILSVFCQPTDLPRLEGLYWTQDVNFAFHSPHCQKTFGLEEGGTERTRGEMVWKSSEELGQEVEENGAAGRTGESHHHSKYQH